jgi:hypothetical protein
MRIKTKKFVSAWICHGCQAANSNSADLCLHCGRAREPRERFGVKGAHRS